MFWYHSTVILNVQLLHYLSLLNQATCTAVLEAKFQTCLVVKYHGPIFWSAHPWDYGY